MAQQQGSTRRAPNKNAYVKGHNPMQPCGDCQLCCKLLPVGSLSKSAGALCNFQKYKRGRAAAMPIECGVWHCRSLVNDNADPAYPQAHGAPALRRWPYRRAADGVAALIRFNERAAITVFAPPFDPAGQWHEIDSGVSVNRTHSLGEVVTALGGRAAAIISEPEKGNDGKASSAPNTR
ncbi:hypothetical protein QA640_09300 [Bradyrhizobium sp. CB82]|uniref:hypothetical protein n=1 Tax=Bradyrhizobium sp. CB82 TaxID=3039159 RepID=UPI0024B109D6|nr:hypothetical protein [Bradyrhizobium sp. CB82]WFU42630.1 hypothetical protein QA640_09300 [Bradyrhizobium sp. CB82]